MADETSGNLTLSKVLGVIAECDLIMRPWLPLVGLIVLRDSEYCPEGDVFAIAGSRLVAESHDMVLCHSREVLAKALPELKSDDERAAYVWWCAEQSRKVSR